MYFSCKKANFRVFCVVLPDRLMVGLIPLEDSILVRVQVWQPLIYKPYMNNNIILETDYWSVELIKDQLYLGRCVVLLKRECGNLAGINENEILDFLNLVKKLETLFKKTFNATMFNWTCLMNNAYKETEPKPQIHWHFRPRYRENVEVEGYTFKDPNFGHHYLHGKGNEFIISDEVLKIINLKLKENL